jgi:DNA invertase Pin-like site-specific DNA recombinase
MQSKLKTAVVYCRTSTPRQREADSIGTQIEACRRIIETHGLSVLPYGNERRGWVIDDGVSGSLLGNRAFLALLEDLQEGRLRVDYLVVYSLCRIARIDTSSADMGALVESHTAAARIKAVLLGARVGVIDEDGVIDPGTMIFDMKMMVATEEYRRIRSRVELGKKRRLSEGSFSKGGRPPYGYLQVPRNGTDRKKGFTLVPHPEEAPRLAHLVAWYLEGGLQFAARKACEEGLPTPMHRTTERKNAAKDWSPTRWSPVSIQHIIRNARAYLGSTSLTIGGTTYQIVYEPLIDAKTLGMLEHRQAERRVKKRTVFLSTGFVDCACGSHVQAVAAGGGHYAKCKNCRVGVRQDEMEFTLWAAVFCRFVQIRRHARPNRAQPEGHDAAIAAARENILVVTQKIERLLVAFLDAGLDRVVYAAQNERLNAEKTAAQAALERLQKMRDQSATRHCAEISVGGQLDAIIQELASTQPGTKRRRQLLSDLVQGQRIQVAWGPREQRGKLLGCALNYTLTLPAWGSLPPATVRSDADIRAQLLGPETPPKKGARGASSHAPGGAEEIATWAAARGADRAGSGKPRVTR